MSVAAFAFPALTIKTLGSAIFLFIFSKHISTGADLNLFEVNKPDQIAFFSSFTIEVSNLVPYFVLEDASSKTKYGTRLDTSIVKLEKKAIWSGLFTSNKFKSAPVEICLEKMNKNIAEPKVLIVNAGNANAATDKKGKKDS